MAITPQEIIAYWYSGRLRKRWFSSTPALDDEIRERFEPLWREALAGELDHWRESPEGCLALVIVLDQFPLNMYRGQAASFSSEKQAVETACYSVEQGFDKLLPQDQLSFLYMPLMHSENLADQDLSVKLFEQAGLTVNLKFASYHRGLIERFGRFPHRNRILGRENTPEETDYLASDKAFKG